ncbi:DUF4339 domain-containing protein [Myroides sp. LJL119]
MRKYFYLQSATVEGPFTLEELKKANPSPITLIWHKELKHWIQAEQVDELKEFFGLPSNKKALFKTLLITLAFVNPLRITVITWLKHCTKKQLN